MHRRLDPAPILIPLEITLWCLGGISACPQHSHQHQSNGSHTGEHLSPLQFRGDDIRQPSIDRASISRTTPQARTTRAGVGIRFKGCQNRTILLKCGQPQRVHDLAQKRSLPWLWRRWPVMARLAGTMHALRRQLEYRSLYRNRSEAAMEDLFDTLLRDLRDQGVMGLVDAALPTSVHLSVNRPWLWHHTWFMQTEWSRRRNQLSRCLGDTC